MKILVLNGSPRPNGNTKAMVNAFLEGAKENGNDITVIDVCRKKVTGCMACEYCHTSGSGKCIQDDDMQEIYPIMDEAEMIVLASPIYYHGFTAQLQCVIHRMYALDKPKNLKQAALLLSSGSDLVFSGAVFEYQNSFIDYLNLKNMGMIAAHGSENRSPEKLEQCRKLGSKIK